MSDKHTPGPWRCDKNSGPSIHGISADREGFRGKPIIRWHGIAAPASPEGQANARLIASAPAMKEALRVVKDSAGWFDMTASEQNQVIHALQLSDGNEA